MTDRDAPLVRTAVLAERARIVDVLRETADGYRTMTRAVLLDVADQVERADHEVACTQCGALRSDVERSQSARRPIPCERHDSSGGVVAAWLRHRFAVPRSER